MNERNEIEALIRRYQNGLTTATEDQLVESILFADTEEKKELQEELTRKAALWAQLETTIRPVKRRPFKWYYAAAAILIVLGFSTLFVLQKQSNQKAQLSHTIQNQDIIAGTNKATLTFADGRQYELDNQEEGIVFQEGHIHYAGDSTRTIVSQSTQPQTALLQLKTPRGGQYQITLSDGTKVWLNAASILRYPEKFTGDTREVYLDGEAYFEVNESPLSLSTQFASKEVNKKKPFIVKSPQQQTLVLGTKFNINTYEKISKTTLSKGRIQVKSMQGTELSLVPEEQASCSINGLTKEKVNIEQALAWRYGKFSFDNKSFVQVMDELARWYDLSIEYENGIPNGELVGDAFRNQNLKLVLRVLDAIHINYRLDVDQRKLIIIGKK